MVGVSIDVSSMRHAIRSGSPAHASFVWTGRELLLAFRAPERRAPVLGEALDDAAAAGGLALLALAIVDLKGMLEIAELAGGLAMIAQRRAAGLDRLVQHRVNRTHQTFGMIGRFTRFFRQRRRQPSRRQMRAIQRLADIDVAEARDHALVEQRR